jgi:hypothetical protein
MTSFGLFALLWPFFAIAVAVASVLAFHRRLDRHEQRQHPAE